MKLIDSSRPTKVIFHFSLPVKHKVKNTRSLTGTTNTYKLAAKKPSLAKMLCKKRSNMWKGIMHVFQKVNNIHNYHQNRCLKILNRCHHLTYTVIKHRHNTLVLVLSMALDVSTCHHINSIQLMNSGRLMYVPLYEYTLSDVID